MLTAAAAAAALPLLLLLLCRCRCSVSEVAAAAAAALCLRSLSAMARDGSAFFGESAILGSGPDGGRRNASISAASHLVLLRLSRETCTELLGSSKEVFEREARRRARENELAEQVIR